MTERSLSTQLTERGLTADQWHTLRHVIWPSAKTNATVLLAFDYCRARKLDPFKKPVNIVPVWDPDAGRLVDSIWPSINELRSTAFRTGEYAGKGSVIFGPAQQETFGDGKDAVTLTYPEYAQVVVYRIVAGEPRAFWGDPVFWRETYAAKKSGAPNKMWRSRPWGQLAKTAEANALRIGFPEELGQSYTEDEIEGKEVTGAARMEETPGTSEGADDINQRVSQYTGQEEPQTLEHQEGETVEDLVPTETSEPETVPAGEEESSPDYDETAPDETQADSSGTGETQTPAEKPGQPEETTGPTVDRAALFQAIEEAGSLDDLELLDLPDGDDELYQAYQNKAHQLADLEAAAEAGDETQAETAPPGGSGGFPELPEDD